MLGIQEAGREEERIIGGIKVPRSEKGIFVTNQRLTAIDFVKWMTDGRTEEDMKAPVKLSDLDKYKLLEAKKEDILKVELKAPTRFHSGSLLVRTKGAVLEFIPSMYLSDGYFEELHALLLQSCPDQLTNIGKAPKSISGRISEWVKWGAAAVLFLLAAVYFYLVYIGIASMM
jgi:hypothetical protein